MADIKYYDVILKPVITEKSMNAMSDKKYTFLVHVDANKSMIKEAVEKMFPGTKVASVNTMNCDGKNKRRGLVVGKTAATKKAIVKLTEDSKEIRHCPQRGRRAGTYPPGLRPGRRTYTAGRPVAEASREKKGVKSHGN